MGAKRVTAGSESTWRQSVYEASTAFNEALLVVRHDLHQAAKMHPNDVKAFVSWVRHNGLTVSTLQARGKANEFDPEISASLRLYIGYVLRFRVYLKFVRRESALEFVPNYEGSRHSQLKFRVRLGKLVPLPVEPEADVRDRFASIGGIPAQIRKRIKDKGSRILLTEQIKLADAELMERGMSKVEVDSLRASQRLRGSNPEDAKLRIVEVHSEDTSAVTELLDRAYDPLSITFLLVESREQPRLMCLVGELVSNYEWNQLGVVRAIVHKVRRGKGPAGAPVNLKQFAQDIDRIPPDGKLSTPYLVGMIGGHGSDIEIKRIEKRLQRAKSRAERVRQQISL